MTQLYFRNEAKRSENSQFYTFLNLKEISPHGRDDINSRKITRDQNKGNVYNACPFYIFHSILSLKV